MYILYFHFKTAPLDPCECFKNQKVLYSKIAVFVILR